MKIKGKKIVAVLCAVCALNFMAAGCGNDSAAGETSQADVTSEADATSEADVTGEADATSEADVTGEADITRETDVTEEAEVTDVTETEQGDTTESNVEGRWHVLAPDIAAIVDADFEGSVMKIDADFFYIAETQTEIMEDGSLLGVDASTEAQLPDSDLIQVVFEEDARFYIRTIYENGARHEDSEAEFKDLEQNMSVSLKGEFAGDVFHAKEIRMNKTE